MEWRKTLYLSEMSRAQAIDEAVEDYLLENKDLIDRVVDGKGSKQDIKTILNKLLSI